jgi:RNA polymerase sigma factor (sigma-70 family)
MASRQSAPLLESFQRLFTTGTLTGAGERQLLDRFLADGDADAFEAIVRRHGPMVLSVCGRVLSDPNDVEDAFQATFLVLVRKAGSIRDRTVLGAWLHGVARHVSVRARVNARRRQAREQSGIEMAIWQDRRPGNESRAELRSVIDQEVSRLPERYRVPLVLCDLEGRSQDGVAAVLGCPVGTVKSRLSRGRDRLRTRLIRRGFAPSAGSLAALLSPDCAPAMTPELLAATVGAATRVAAGRVITSGAVPAAVAALVEHTSRSLSMNSLKFVIVLAAAGIVVASAGTFAYQAGGNKAPQPAPIPPEKGKTAKVKPGLTEARKAYDLDAYRAQVMSLLGARHGPEKTAGLEQFLAKYFAAVGETADRAKDRSDDVERARAEFYRLEAERWLARLKSGQEPDLPVTAIDRQEVPKAGVRPGTDPRSQALLARLEEPIAMSFPNPTPLEDVLKYIQQASAGPDFLGIQIYVDPVDPSDGEIKSEQIMKTRVTMNLEGVPLRRVLKLLAEQIGMGYGIKDGMVTMRPPDMRNRNWLELMVMEESFPDSSPLAQEVDRARRGELTENELMDLEAKLQAIDEVTKRYRSIRMMAAPPGAGPGGMTPGPARAPGGPPQ